MSTPIEEFSRGGQAVVFANMILSKGIFGIIAFVIFLPLYLFWWCGEALGRSVARSLHSGRQPGAAPSQASPPLPSPTNAPLQDDHEKFEVVIKSVAPEKKIAVIKAIRVVTDCDLALAKEISESLPVTLFSQLSFEEAKAAHGVLANAGAEVEMNGDRFGKRPPPKEEPPRKESESPMQHDTIIHLEWEGPLTMEDARSRQGETDWGVYQIYGNHPLYGCDVLLYIGKAERQFFGVRLAQEKWWDDGADANRLTVYLGRLAGEVAPDDETWCRMIDLAERILIFAHKPAMNAQKNLGSMDADLQSVHVMNWGKYRSLAPEVSGARWTSRLNSMTKWHVFDAVNSPRSKS